MKKLVILPGWGGSRKTWTNFVKAGRKKFDIQVINLPGFGDEPCPDKVWGIEDYADFVKLKILKHNEHNAKLILLGHSFGGQIAVYLLNKYPNFADQLILSGAAVIRPNKKLRRIFFGIIAKTGKAFFKIPRIKKYRFLFKKILYRISGSQDYIKTAGIKRDIYKKIIRQDIVKLLPKIKVPTLVLWGEKDKMTPLKYGKKIAKLLPNAELRIFKKRGHGLHNEITDEYLNEISYFINKKNKIC